MRYKHNNSGIYKSYNITYVNKIGKEMYGNVVYTDNKDTVVRELYTNEQVRVRLNAKTGVYHEKPQTHAKIQMVILPNADSFIIHSN